VTASVEMSPLHSKPYGCPPEVQRGWARYVATHQSVDGLFKTLNELRRGKGPGAVPEGTKDLARAAIVFTAAGVDSCLRTLLHDALETLLAVDGAAHGAFKKHLYSSRLSGELTKATKTAVTAVNPRAALIELYVQDLTGTSIQSWQDLSRVRDALGLAGTAHLDDAVLQMYQPFFNARHQVVHELDLVDPSGKGSRGRRPRDLVEVGAQCNEALHMLAGLIKPAAQAVKEVRAELGAEAGEVGTAARRDVSSWTSSIRQDLASIHKSLGGLEGHAWD
jgi:hypothetical protein